MLNSILIYGLKVYFEGNCFGIGVLTISMHKVYDSLTPWITFFPSVTPRPSNLWFQFDPLLNFWQSGWAICLQTLIVCIYFHHSEHWVGNWCLFLLSIALYECSSWKRRWKSIIVKYVSLSFRTFPWLDKVNLGLESYNFILPWSIVLSKSIPHCIWSKS